jgi:hypothetical protein
MVHFKKSYQFGKKQEAIVLPLIREFFADDAIRPTEGQYCKYDFTSNDYNFELKSRTISVERYPTTMITCNKLISSEDKRLLLLFSFTDGLYFVEYDDDIFSSFEKKQFSRAGLDWDEKEHIYIPIDYLKLIKHY